MTECMGGPDAYRAQIVRRPFPGEPSELVADLTVVAATWERKLNEISKASVTVPANHDCCDQLSLLANAFSTLMYELHIYRDPDGLVWAGRLLEVSQDPSLSSDVSTAELSAEGLLGWANSRVFAAPMPFVLGGPGQPSWVSTELTTIWVDWWEYLMSKDNPDIGVTVAPVGVTGSRSVTLSEAKLGWVVLKDLIDAGVWVAEYGRNLLVGDLTQIVPRLGTITEEWFSDPPETRVTSDTQATLVYTTGGAGVLGSYGGAEPSSGLLLEATINDTTATDVASANARSQTEVELRGQALAFVEGTNGISPSAPVNIQQLIPGARANIDLTARCIQVLEDMVLTEVSVSYSPSNDSTESLETVSVTFEPYGQEAEVI